MRVNLTVLLLALLASACLARPATAQVGATTDILTGTVSDSAGRPLAGVAVEAVSVETGILRTATTDGHGRYRILFPDGGGRYQLFARLIGMTPVRRLVQRQGDDDRLVTDLRLTPQAVTLDEVMVIGRAPVTQEPRLTPGATETSQSADRLARLPIDAGDLTAIAGLAPGVVTTAATDSTTAAFSVAGQRASANTTTLDGLTYGAQSIPQDAVRTTRVITNTYDVARGQFSGGLVASTTRSGTSAFQASATGGLRDPALAVAPDSVTTTAQAVQQLSFGLGGPLLPNRLFGYGAGQVRHRGNDLVSLLTLAGGGSERYGVAQDSVDRYVGVLGGLGVPLTTGGIPDSRSGTDWSGIGRIDLLLDRRNTLTLRGDWRDSRDQPARLAPLAPPISGGRTTSRGGGVLLQLSSQIGQSLLNEAKAYLSGSRNAGDPYLRLPQGRVQLSSALPDGTIGLSTLTFGGSSSFPQRGRGTSFEATNELSWLSPDGKHRVKLGLFYTTTRTTQEVAANQLGTFTFQSLDDLAAGRPALFTRTLGADERTGRSSTSAAYLGDTWRRSPALQLTYGVRVEHSWFGDAPAYNAAVDSAFGLRTDRLPKETHLSPRVGFTWLARSPDGPPRWTVRGGVGEFRSPVPAQLAVAAQAASGTGNGQTQLVCAGPAAPTPDWAAMIADPAAIPAACAGGGPGGPPAATPSITAFAGGFTAPRVWRGSLGVQRRSGLVTFGLDLSGGIGVSQWGFEDRNIGPTRFTLAGESGRQVFASPAAFDSVTGTVPLAASRRDSTFGQVFAAISTLNTRSLQAVLSVNGIVGKGIAFNASYTLSRATDLSSSTDVGGARGFAGQTAGRTLRDRNRTPSDFDRRHQFVGTVTVPVVRGLELTAITRATSGAPYTPGVAGDINGDGSRNDRAFIFDPAAAADPAVAAAMSRLLAAAPGRVRDCLTRQLGRIAGRNSCRGPWQPSLDLQVNWRPSLFGLNQRLTLSLLTSNLLAGLDQLFHSDTDLRGWGQFTRPDATLLTVRGFDAGTSNFTYDVNERFGSIRGSQTVRQPFQVGIQARVALGAAPRFGGGGGGPGGGGPGFGGPGGGFGGPPGGPAQGAPPPAEAGAAPSAGAPAAADSSNGFVSRFAQSLPDPIAPIVALNIQLRLTDDQLAHLAAISDSFVQQRDSLARGVNREIERAGVNPDRAVIITTLRRAIGTGRELAEASLERARGVLTAEQWAQLPEEAKAPPRGGFGPPGGPGGPGGERPRP